MWYEFAPQPSNTTIQKFAVDLRHIRYQYSREYEGVNLEFLPPYVLESIFIILNDEGLERYEQTGDLPWSIWDAPFKPESVTQSNFNPKFLNIRLPESFNTLYVCREYRKLFGIDTCGANSYGGSPTSTFPIVIVPKGDTLYYIFTNGVQYGNDYLLLRKRSNNLKKVGIMPPRDVFEYFGEEIHYLDLFHRHNYHLSY